MAKIQILPEDLANRIAAGEVVERPASIVKELIENSLDAGATRVSIDIEGGGRTRIRVADDGEGMSPEDAANCLYRHATSKLYTPDDLFSIKTLGFRGEAIPSIAAVSRFTLETQAEGAAGTRIEVAGGKLVSSREGAFPKGTQITVEDLFFNVPARRKFLRSESYELSQVTSYATHYALAFPQTHFLLKSAGFEILSATPVETARERVFQVFGGDLLDDLVEYRQERDRTGLGIQVFTSRPHVQKYNRNSMFFFINRRLVRDKIIMHAISEAYRNILPSGSFPVVILYLTIPFEDVDVNVHPAKTEVRFKHQSLVHDRIRDGILSALRDDKSVVEQAAERQLASPFTLPAPPPRIPDSWNEGPLAQSPFSLESIPMPHSGTAIPMRLPFGTSVVQSECGEVMEIPASPDFDQIRSEIRVLGQIRDSFIVGADASGLVVIDQHVAHERVLFEAYIKQKASSRVEVQKLLLPIVVELSPRQLVVLDNIIPELEQSGFEVEPFGPKTVAIRAVPALLKSGAVERLLRELLDGLEKETQVVNIELLQRRIAATVSCHAAIKINMALDNARMTWLIGELMRTDVPTVCPHGRPIILRYDIREILKGFRRV